MADTVAVTYIGPFDEVWVPVGQLELTCARGASIEVPADVAEGLLGQTSNWEPAKPATTPAEPAEED